MAKRYPTGEPSGPTKYLERLSPKMQHVVNQIYGDTGDIVRVKPKALNKFGRNLAVAANTRSTVAEFQGNAANETFVATNLIDSVVNSNAADNGKQVYIEGHYLNGSDWVFTTQTRTLGTPTSAGSLSQNLLRGTRLRLIGSAPAAGTIALYDSSAAGGLSSGLPANAPATKCLISAGRQQSEKCATALSFEDYWIIVGVNTGVDRGTGADVGVEFDIEYRVKGTDTWIPLGLEEVIRRDSQTGLPAELPTYRYIPKHSDVRMIALAGASSTVVSGAIFGYLALVQQA